MWDLLVPRQISRFPKIGVTDLSFSPSGVLFGVASDHGGLEVWETSEQKLLFNQECPAKYMAWSWPMSAGLNDGGINGGSGFAQLVSVERDGKIRLFDRLNENKPSVCELPVDRPIRPYAAQFSWRNFLMVAGVQDDTNIYGDLQICVAGCVSTTTTTSTTTIAPTTTTTSTTTTTTTVAPTTTTTTTT